MFLKTQDNSLIKKYKVENKNIAHLERILKRKVFVRREISLHSVMDWEILLPNGAKQFLTDVQYDTSDRIDFTFNAKLKDYQNAVIFHIMKHWCGLIDLKTWAWKSFVVMWVINLIKKRSLIIVPTKKLLIEMRDKIKEFMNYDAGVWYWDKKELKDITITTTASYSDDHRYSLWMSSRQELIEKYISDNPFVYKTMASSYADSLKNICAIRPSIHTYRDLVENGYDFRKKRKIPPHVEYIDVRFDITKYDDITKRNELFHNEQELYLKNMNEFINKYLWKKHDSIFKNAFNVILVDECDTGMSDDFIHWICESNCDYLIWLTGTPSRTELNTNDLSLFYWPYIQVWWYQEKPTEIIQYIYKRDRQEEILHTKDNFVDTRTSVIDNSQRTEKIIEKCLELKNKYYIMLILTDRVEECEIIQRLIPWSIVIHWNTKLKDDNASIEKIKQTWWVIIGTRQKMGRWVDIPAIDCVALVWAFKFKPSVIQSIWRALRKYDWKTAIWVYIFSDSILYGQATENKKTCEREYGVPVTREILNT